MRVGQVINLRCVELVMKFGRFRVSAPKFERHFLYVAGNDLPQFAGPFRQVARCVIEPEGPARSNSPFVVP